MGHSSRVTKKELWDSREYFRNLMEAATKRAEEQAALAAARLQEVQQLQDEVVGLQVALGDALDTIDRSQRLLLDVQSKNLETIASLREKMNETPGEKLREALERFRKAFRSRV
jgi:hypothetical protein